MTIDGTKKYPMFGGAQQLSLDELVHQLVPVHQSGSRRRKLSKYQTYIKFTATLIDGLGSDILDPVLWYVLEKANLRAMGLNNTLIAQGDCEYEYRLVVGGDEGQEEEELHHVTVITEKPLDKRLLMLIGMVADNGVCPETIRREVPTAQAYVTVSGSKTEKASWVDGSLENKI